MPFEFYNYQNVEFGVFEAARSASATSRSSLLTSVKTLLYEMVLANPSSDELGRRRD